MNMKSKLAVIGLIVGFIVSGCGGEATFTSLLNPPCMPDGTPVLVQYANSQGSFEAARADLGQCPWAKPQSNTD